jgi:hypothetical protein
MWKKHKYHCYVVINSNLKDKMGRRFRLLTSDDKSNTNNKDQWLRLLTSDDKLNTTNIDQWLRL